MIRNFKIFENWSDISRITNDLASQFSQKYIDKYFEENFMMDAREIIDLWPKTIFSHIDEDRWKEDFIEDEINALSIDEFGDYEYSKFLENEISNRNDEEIEKKILKAYNKKLIKNGKDPENDFEYYMLDTRDGIKLKDKELKKIITDLDLEEDFVKYAVNDRYDNQDAEDIMSGIYGELKGDEAWQTFSYYVDEDEIVDSWLSEQDKTEKLSEEIYRDIILQNKLLKINKRNVIPLAKVLAYYKDDNIGGTYSFQKNYMKYIVDYKENAGKDINYVLAEAYKFLNDNFNIHPKIAEKYKDYSWLDNINKYEL